MRYRPTKNVFLLALTSFFNDLSSEMVLSVFPAFFVSVLKTGAGSLGFVEGFADGVSNIVKIYGGRLSDSARKRKPFIVVGYSLSVLTRPFYILVSSVAGVAGLRFTDRIGKGIRDGPRDAVVSLSTPREQLGRAFGYHRMWDTFGAIAGPLIAYLILSRYPSGFNIVFSTAFVMGIAAIITLFFVKEIADGVKKNNITLASLAVFPKSFRWFLFALFFLSLGSLPVAVLLLKTQNLGLTLASIPLFYTLYNLSFASFSFAGGKASDRIGPKTVIIIGYLILLASYIFLAFAESPVFLAAGFLVLGLFPAMTDGVLRALASGLSSAEHRGGALGLVNAVAGIGLLCAGVGGGFVWERFGVSYAFALAGIFVLVGVSILFMVKKEKIA